MDLDHQDLVRRKNLTGEQARIDFAMSAFWAAYMLVAVLMILRMWWQP